MSVHLLEWTPLQRARYWVKLAGHPDPLLQRRVHNAVRELGDESLYEALLTAVLSEHEDRVQHTEATRTVAERSLQALADAIEQQLAGAA